MSHHVGEMTIRIPGSSSSPTEAFASASLGFAEQAELGASWENKRG
jgi:hypothetical protein